MKLNRYMVVLFQQIVDNNSVAKILEAISPEVALQRALRVDSSVPIEYTGTLDGIPFYKCQDEEHIVYKYP